MFIYYLIPYLSQGSQQNLEKPGELNFICSGPKIAWNLPPKMQNLDKTRNLAEIMDKKPGMLRYATFQYYIETMFSIFCTSAVLECLWCLPFSTKIAHTKKPGEWPFWHGQNLEITRNILAKKTGNPAYIFILIALRLWVYSVCRFGVSNIQLIITNSSKS